MEIELRRKGSTTAFLRVDGREVSIHAPPGLLDALVARLLGK